MKKIFIALLAVILLSNAGTFAGEEYYEKETPTKMEEREVIFYDHDLELELENGIVEAEWDDFEIDGFDWFKLVYSATNSNPVYPDDRTVFVGSEDQTEAEFKLDVNASNHYVRLCAVVLNEDYSKDRYCGRVQKIETSDEDFEDKEEKEYLEKKYTEKKAVTYEKKSVSKNTLGETMKDRIDDVIESFIEKLQERGYSDAQITATINTVISRLGEFKNKAGYKKIVAYMIEVLEQYREEYSNPLEDLESIFDGL